MEADASWTGSGLEPVHGRLWQHVSLEPVDSSGARGQDLSRCIGGFDEYPLGRNQRGWGPGRVSFGLDAGHGQKRFGVTGERSNGNPAAVADLAGLHAAGRWFDAAE